MSITARGTNSWNTGDERQVASIGAKRWSSIYCKIFTTKKHLAVVACMRPRRVAVSSLTAADTLHHQRRKVPSWRRLKLWRNTGAPSLVHTKQVTLSTRPITVNVIEPCVARCWGCSTRFEVNTRAKYRIFPRCSILPYRNQFSGIWRYKISQLAVRFTARNALLHIWHRYPSTETRKHKAKLEKAAQGVAQCEVSAYARSCRRCVATY